MSVGCCWAFSAVAAMEGINQLTTGKLISLSEQELVDCDTSGVDQGCEGGLMDDAFEFIIQNKGLTTESSYSYKGVDGTCNKNKADSSAAKITGFEDVLVNSESALLKAAAHQPVSVAIDASGSAFLLKYWLVKNSWGTSWREDGYIRMERDINAEEGLCGIAMKASYPTA